MIICKLAMVRHNSYRIYICIASNNIALLQNIKYKQLSSHIYLAGWNEFRPLSHSFSPPLFCTPQVFSHRFRALGKSQNPADYTICRLKSRSSFQLRAMQKQRLKRHKKTNELLEKQPYLLPALLAIRTCK